MRKTKYLTSYFSFVLVFFLLFSNCAFSQTNTEEENITTQFFKTFSKDPIKAYEELFNSNEFISKSDIESTKIKFNEFLSDVGDYLGNEIITVKKAGKSYILKSFLLKYERMPIRFTFILYKPRNKWKIQNFSYDGSINEELENAAKIDKL